MLQIILEKSRFILIIAVLGSLGAALILLFFGAYEIIGILIKAFNELPQLKTLALKLIEIIDVFLIATVFLIVAVGLYELFINPDVKVPDWLEINSLDDLKTKLVGTVVIVLGILFLGSAASWKGDTEILSLGIGIGAVIVALTYFTSIKK